MGKKDEMHISSQSDIEMTIDSTKENRKDGMNRMQRHNVTYYIHWL